MTTDLIRPAAAAERFSLSETTLRRWADLGWIGRSKVGGVVLYVADDIGEVIAAHQAPRKVVPINLPTSTSEPSFEQWGGLEEWQRRKRSTVLQ